MTAPKVEPSLSPPANRAPGWEYFGAAVIATLAFLLAGVIAFAIGWPLPLALFAGLAGAGAAWVPMSAAVKRERHPTPPGVDRHTVIPALISRYPELRVHARWIVLLGLISLIAGPIWWTGNLDGWDGLAALRSLARFGLIAVPSAGIMHFVFASTGGERWHRSARFIGIAFAISDFVLLVVSAALATHSDAWRAIQDGYTQFNIFTGLRSPGFYVWIGGAYAVWLGASLSAGHYLTGWWQQQEDPPAAGPAPD